MEKVLIAIQFFPILTHQLLTLAPLSQKGKALWHNHVAESEIRMLNLIEHVKEE